jgi:ketosteroid isomerase-like protein
MSQENVKVVRRSFQIVGRAIRDREFPEEEAKRIFDPEIRFDVSRRVFNPRVYKGIGGLRQMIEDLWDVWEEFELLPKDFLDAGDEVVVLLEERGRTRNGLETTREIAYMYTVRDGRVIEWTGAMDPEEALSALEAAGLSE